MIYFLFLAGLQPINIENYYDQGARERLTRSKIGVYEPAVDSLEFDRGAA